MNGAHSLLAELRSRGVDLRLDGDRLRWRAPRGVLSQDLLTTLREHREQVRDLLRCSPQTQVQLILDCEPAEVRERVAAVLIRSPVYGEVWIALDRCMVLELAAEEKTRPDPRPVLVAEDLVRLRGRSEQTIRAELEIARAFPGARVV